MGSKRVNKISLATRTGASSDTQREGCRGQGKEKNRSRKAGPKERMLPEHGMSGAESTSGVYETDHTAPQTLSAPRRAPTRTIPMVRRVPTHTVTSEVHTQQRGRETMAAVQVARERGVVETSNNRCTYLPLSSQGLTLAHACPTRRHGDEADANGGWLLTHGGGGRQFCCGRVQQRGTMQ